MSQYRIGFDIGGTKCAVLLGHGDNTHIDILERVAFATVPEGGPNGVLARLTKEARALMVKHKVNLDEVCGIGISCGGPLSSREGLVLSPPNLPGWDRIPIVKYFQDELHLPAYLQNDANACAVAEHKWGAGRGCQNMVFLTFGTGMGAGLILDGRLYAGTNDLGGEVGHMRLAESGPVGFGKAGSFEGWCSGGGIARLAQARLREAWAAGKTSALCTESKDPAGLEAITAKRVFEAADGGDALALGVVQATAQYLGRGLSILIDVLNPEVIVIGSIFARRQRELWPECARLIAEEAIPLAAQVCQIVPAQLGEAIGDYACLAIANGIGDV